MIIAIVASFHLLFGGGAFSFDHVADMAQEVIKDKDRAKQVVLITEQVTEEYETFSGNLDDLFKKLVKMNKNYDLTRAEMAAFSDESKNNRLTFLNQYVELRFQLKDLVTVEEWKAMHPQ